LIEGAGTHWVQHQERTRVFNPTRPRGPAAFQPGKEPAMKRLLPLIVVALSLLAIAVNSYARGDIAAGKEQAAAACAGCHGANGEGKGSYPALAGMSEEDVEHALKDYKSGKRSNGVMKLYASKLSENQMENLGAYYASLKGK
jgi:cytochrome c553